MSFDNLIGNSEVKDYLIKASMIGEMSQSYLFVGTEGIGKLLMAKEFAKKILCLNEKKDDCECKSCKSFEGLNHPDFYVLNEEGETIKIEQIREMISKVIEPPIVSSKKVYLINDCEKMTIEAQNCLLKTLEEPPQFAIIILICARENLILNTIKSRCMTIKFKNISNEELREYAVDKLGYTQITEDVLEYCNGSVAQMMIHKQNQDKLSAIQQIVDHLPNQDIVHIMNEAKILYEKEDIDDFLSYMTAVLFKKNLENKRYLDCVEIINHCRMRLRRNCNFDMCLDTMFLDMWECMRKGI